MGLMNFELNSHIQTLLKRSGCAEMLFVAKRKTIPENHDHPWNIRIKRSHHPGVYGLKDRNNGNTHHSVSSMIGNDAFVLMESFISSPFSANKKGWNPKFLQETGIYWRITTQKSQVPGSSTQIHLQRRFEHNFLAFGAVAPPRRGKNRDSKNATFL